MSSKTISPGLTDSEFAVIRRTVSRQLTKRRRLRKLRHEDVADAVGKTLWTSMRWCSGRLVPDLRELVGLSRLYRCKVAELTGIP